MNAASQITHAYSENEWKSFSARPFFQIVNNAHNKCKHIITSAVSPHIKCTLMWWWPAWWVMRVMSDVPIRSHVNAAINTTIIHRDSLWESRSAQIAVEYRLSAEIMQRIAKNIISLRGFHLVIPYAEGRGSVKSYFRQSMSLLLYSSLENVFTR